jgi:hypothetical protein
MVACGAMAAANDRSPWLDAILKLERAVGEQVESVLQSDAYFEFVAQATRARNRLAGAVEGAQEEWLHLFNLPAATDVRRLREQVSRLERDLEALSNGLGDQLESDGGTPEATPRPRQPRPAEPSNGE